MVQMFEWMELCRIFEEILQKGGTDGLIGQTLNNNLYKSNLIFPTQNARSSKICDTSGERDNVTFCGIAVPITEYHELLRCSNYMYFTEFQF